MTYALIAYMLGGILTVELGIRSGAMAQGAQGKAFAVYATGIMLMVVWPLIWMQGVMAYLRAR